MNIKQTIKRIIQQSAKYPTKEEIMEEPWPTHKRALIRDIIAWKREMWLNTRSDTSRKARALTSLVNIMGEHYNTRCNFLIHAHIQSPCYHPDTKTIYMNASMSILSTMHEFAHHQFGSNEKKACKWSVHLFRKTFPKAYKKLIWRGHCLVKPQ